MKRTVKVLTALLIAVLMACTTPTQEQQLGNLETTTEAPPVTAEKRNATAREDTPEAAESGQKPEWVRYFSRNQNVLRYNWYKGDNCPSGKYSHRDDLFIFDSEDALSPIEVQGRNLEGKIIGSKGFHSTAGHICVALSEEISPASYTSLHELAHAVAYSEHGLTGHNEIHDRILIDMALRFEKANCRTKDPELLTLIDWNRIQLRWGTKGEITPEDTALAEWCVGDEAAEPERKISTQPPIAESSPKPAPTANPEHRSLEINYDASTVINNRRPPTGITCENGWTRTVHISQEEGRIQDGNDDWVHVTQLDFRWCHSHEGYYAQATVVNVTSDRPPDLTGYTAEWRDGNSNLIASTPVNITLGAENIAHPLIEVTVKDKDRPRDLFDMPAKFLLYDNHTRGAQPTATPEPEVEATQKQLALIIDIVGWEKGKSEKKQERYLGTQIAEWTETPRMSGPIEPTQHVIYDAKGRQWHVTEVVATERSSFIESYTDTLYQLKLENHNRATADFSGYRVDVLNPEGTVIGGGKWTEPESPQETPVGLTYFIAYNREPETRAVTIRLWDPFHPTLTPTTVP